MKNITLSADEKHIEKARQRAKAESSTLNAEFRKWLARYVQQNQKFTDYDGLMASLSYAHPGKSFSREDLNER